MAARRAVAFSQAKKPLKKHLGKNHVMSGSLFRYLHFCPVVQCVGAVVLKLHLRSVQCTSPLKGVRCYCTAYAPSRDDALPNMFQGRGMEGTGKFRNRTSSLMSAKYTRKNTASGHCCRIATRAKDSLPGGHLHRADPSQLLFFIKWATKCSSTPSRPLALLRS